MHTQTSILTNINGHKTQHIQNNNKSITSIITDKSYHLRYLQILHTHTGWSRAIFQVSQFVDPSIFPFQLFQKRTSWNEQCKVQVFAGWLPFLSPKHQCQALKDMQSTQTNHGRLSLFFLYLQSDSWEGTSIPKLVISDALAAITLLKVSCWSSK